MKIFLLIAAAAGAGVSLYFAIDMLAKFWEKNYRGRGGKRGKHLVCIICIDDRTAVDADSAANRCRDLGCDVTVCDDCVQDVLNKIENREMQDL